MRVVPLSLAVLVTVVLCAGVLWTWAEGGFARVIGPPQDRAIPGAPRDFQRITAFGTSLTAYTDWPDRLAAQLQTCAGHPVAMTRIAGPGMGSTWALDQLDRVVDSTPDVILLEFAINDADIRDGVPLSVSVAQHQAILAELSARLPQTRILMMTMSHAHGLRRIIRPRLGAYYASYRDLAVGDTGLADLYPRWMAAPSDVFRLPDGLHPTAEQMAEVTLEPVQRLLSAAAGWDCPGA